MFVKASLNLDLQRQYLDLLCDFLDSEYRALQYGEIDDVCQLETSIRQILGSVQEKRREITVELMGAGVDGFASELPRELGETIRRKIGFLADIEKACMSKSSRNVTFSMLLAGAGPGKPSISEIGSFNDMSVESRVQ